MFLKPFNIFLKSCGTNVAQIKNFKQMCQTFELNFLFTCDYETPLYNIQGIYVTLNLKNLKKSKD